MTIHREQGKQGKTQALVSGENLGKASQLLSKST